MPTGPILCQRCDPAFAALADNKHNKHHNPMPNHCRACGHGDCFGHVAEYLGSDNRVHRCQCADTNNRHGKRKPNIGVYETDYGNAAVVNWSARIAYDLDMAAPILISAVTRKFIRTADPADIYLLEECETEE